LPVDHWHAWIGDATIADAILDRIMQRNHRFTLTGESLHAERPKTSKKEKNTDLSCARRNDQEAELAPENRIPC
jgi:hypothetical protein